MRIVADTNLLIASIFWNGAPYNIVQKAIDGKLEIIVSRYILEEVRKVLDDPKERFQLQEQEIEDIIYAITLYAKIIDPLIVLPVVKRDEKDDPIIACAIVSNASFIVTRDLHMLELKEHQCARIVTPEEFLAFFEGEAHQNS